MPELPDVEVFKQYLDATSLHRRIEKVRVKSEKVLKETTADKLKNELEGKTLVSSRRHGKYLFVSTDDDHRLALHFGMTGFLKYFEDLGKEPGHDRLLIRFDNGYHLAYDCMRMLGEVRIVENLGKFLEQKELGPDPFYPEFDLEAFKERFVGRKGMVKTTLMNQKIIAGIGNVYSDEILFQAGIYPKRKVNDLTDRDLETLFDKIKSVLGETIEYRADPAKMPGHFLLPNRQVSGQCPKGHGEIEQIKVSQRTGYYCPRCQEE